MKKRILLKLSGEALAGADKKGINYNKVNEIANEIKELYDLGYIELGIVVGAGNIWRGKEAIDLSMDRSQADYMGMLGTVINALTLENALKNLSLKTKVLSAIDLPYLCERYTKKNAENYLNNGTILIFGGGSGLPFFTTDTAATLRCAELDMDLILMAKNGTDGVYDKDPRVFSDAKKFNTLTHKDIIDKNLKVMDITAAAMCSEINVDIFVFDMNVKGNIKKACLDFSIGTLITSKK